MDKRKRLGIVNPTDTIKLKNGKTMKVRYVSYDMKTGITSYMGYEKKAKYIPEDDVEKIVERGSRWKQAV